jgi:tetratricopeptide (TPR) repeat protein
LNKTGELAEKYLVEDLKDSTLTPTQKDLKAMELNNVAFSVCQWTNKKEWLKKAADWSKKSLEVNRIAELLDTFAQLQYKLGNKEMAIDFQQEAIENARKSNKNTLRYQSTLERMKSGTLK